MQRLFRCRDAREPRDDPRGEILRRKAAARGRDIAVRDEGRVAHFDARLDPPRLGREVGAGGERTAEPTSELQSLMRISYAVSYLTTKKFKDRHDFPSLRFDA